MSAPRIHVLSDTLANQIAAGEVVERPAAVVKELVENAIDAGATQIDIELAEGGRRLVRVRDDGSGMGREDARLSLQRHATSKLQSKDDLFAIGTYGFRGEAVPSIAAVSRFTLLTCEPGALAGTRAVVDGGELVSIEEAGAPVGTTVEVRDLFWNVPARRKFLKRAATEQAHALEAVLRLSLPRLEVGFTVREGDRVLLRSPAGATLADRAELALGKQTRDALLPFEGSVRGVRAWGVAASPVVSAGNGRGIWLFVNGRAIRDRQLMHAVLGAYGEVLPHGRYPSALVFLEVPAAEVDVNVHPAKAEVRLADGRAAYEAIRHAISDVLVRGAYLQPPGGGGGVAASGAQSTGPEGAFESLRTAPGAAAPSDAEHALRIGEALARFGRMFGPGGFGPAGLRPSGVSQGSAGLSGSVAVEIDLDGKPVDAAANGQPSGQGAGGERQLLPHLAFFRGLRFLGQLHRTYLVCEGPRGLVLIDQHAAHERMNYQRLRAAAKARPGPSQPLLVPLVVNLSAPAAALIADAAESLSQLGIEVAAYDGGAVAITALPATLGRLSAAGASALLADLADELGPSGRAVSLEHVQDALLARAACHASVRAHDGLSAGEAQALLEALDETDYGARCAHGRPVVAEWPLAAIEKSFGRDYETHAHAAAPEAL